MITRLVFGVGRFVLGLRGRVSRDRDSWHTRTYLYLMVLSSFFLLWLFYFHVCLRFPPTPWPAKRKVIFFHCIEFRSCAVPQRCPPTTTTTNCHGNPKWRTRPPRGRTQEFPGSGSQGLRGLVHTGEFSWGTGRGRLAKVVVVILLEHKRIRYYTCTYRHTLGWSTNQKPK